MTGAAAIAVEPALLHTQRWVSRVVVGLNLCPFARRPMLDDRIRYRLCAESDRDSQLAVLLEELDRLQGRAEADLATTLVVYPQGLGDFDDFLQRIAEAEHLLAAAGLEGIVQLAHFHPRYRFAGEAADDPSNYTNRSPYPTLHLLREESLSRLLATCPDPEEIPVRNIRRLRELGIPSLEAELASLQRAPEGRA